MFYHEFYLWAVPSKNDWKEIPEIGGYGYFCLLFFEKEGSLSNK